MADKSKRSKRKLTPFLAQEMLFDFAMGRLDPDRKEAIQDFLDQDKEGQELLNAIRRGMEYAESLSATQVSPETMAQLKESENVVSLGRRYSSWHEWPDSLRWSINSIAIAAVVALVVSLIPWSRISFFKPSQEQSMVELAKLPPMDKQKLEALQAQSEEVEAPPAEEGSGDDVIEEETDVPPSRASKVAKRPVESSGDEGGDGVRSAPSAAAAEVSDEAASSRSDGKTDGKADSKAKGFVFRAFMNLGELETLGPRISDLIRDLGGEKAGEVELGWKRGSGRYYHFALPSNNEEKLLEQLRAYGPVRISKDPHPRVMPKGQVRFILWVESTN